MRWIFTFLATSIWLGAAPAVAQQREVDFRTDIAPIFAKHCYSCHGGEMREAGLRLDQAAAALAGGDEGKVIVAGKSAESRLLQLISGADPDRIMPPEGERLSAAQIDLIRAWIDQGAKWPEEKTAEKNTHWSYQPIGAPALPIVKNGGWPRDGLDAFVLAALEKRGIAPSPEADRHVLIRRLYLDLVGLLPPVEEVEAFVGDARPDAYERLVDRLLASPHFGERWGRHWLDMARYADSDGYEKDNPRPDAYLWRDWVIGAINADMPFDQFTVEQLAGDLLPEASTSQKLATAFHRQTLTNTEGGTDQEQFRVEACFDRTETTGAVWLGLTVGCARCHSHKYDAISQREYYQLFSIFNNGDETTTTIAKSEPEVRQYERDKAAHEQAVAELTAKLSAVQEEFAPEFAAWRQAQHERIAPLLAQPIKLTPLEEWKIVSDGGAVWTAQADGSLLASGANPEKAIDTITGRAAAITIDAIRLDLLPDSSLGGGGPGRTPHGNYVLSECRAEIATSADFSDAKLVEFASAKADFEQGSGQFAAAHAIDGKPDTGWAIAPHFGKPHWMVLRLKEPIVVAQPLFVRVTLSQQHGTQHTIGRFKFSLQTGIEPDLGVPQAIAKILSLKEEDRSGGQKKQLLAHFSAEHEKSKKLVAELAALKKKAPAKPELAARIFVQRAENPRATFVLRRGEFLEPIKELEVAPGALATLPPLASRDAEKPADRLDFARWLVSPENPLTPRVTVNHIWRMLFGQGLVRTPADFGVRGDPPTHPALLDWLARQFIEQGWSRKALIKQMVMSATYRQASRYRPELNETDPQNLLLARQNRWRVEGEVLGDISLDAAGLLSDVVGGPSVFPPLPPGIADLSYAGNFKWTDSTGGDRYRRSMYTFFKRTAPHPNLTLFDCPDANLTCVERRASNTPLQALTTLNNATYTESAQAFSARILKADAKSDEDRLATAFQICAARSPSAEEIKTLADLLSESRAWYGKNPDAANSMMGSHAVATVAPPEQAAWVATLRILLNLDQFVTRE